MPGTDRCIAPNGLDYRRLLKVINALTDRKSNHVPYRDSKLSRVGI